MPHDGGADLSIIFPLKYKGGKERNAHRTKKKFFVFSFQRKARALTKRFCLKKKIFPLTHPPHALTHVHAYFIVNTDLWCRWLHHRAQGRNDP